MVGGVKLKNSALSWHTVPYITLSYPKVGLYRLQEKFRWGGVGGVGGGGGVQSHFHVKPNLHWIVLGCWLSCGFDKIQKAII